MSINRRVFVRQGALALLALGVAPEFISRSLFAATPEGARKKTLICIFQRGAVDGLNMVVPFGERAYAEYRSTIAIPPPPFASPRLETHAAWSAAQMRRSTARTTGGWACCSLILCWISRLMTAR